jgi:hypothetical protein
MHVRYEKIDFLQVTLRLLEYSSATNSASDSPMDPEEVEKRRQKRHGTNSAEVQVYKPTPY